MTSGPGIGFGLALALAFTLAVPACRTYDDARVLQTLNQRGFGRPTYDANRQYYVGIGDVVVMRDSQVEFNGITEEVRMDGVITLPEIGEVYVNGLSPEEITQVVRLRFQQAGWLNVEDMRIEVTGIGSKRYYITGVPPRRPTTEPLFGDVTLLDALIKANIDEHLVATDEILVIRGDPEQPLLIPCDYDAIKSEGRTRDNILIRENDIIYLTPSWLGYITMGVDAMLSPLQPIRELIVGTNQIISTANSFGQQQNSSKFNTNNNFN